MTYKKCGFVLIAFLIVFIFVLSSCSYEDIKQKLFESMDFEIVVSADFEVLDDVSAFEDRLSVLGFSVLSKNENDKNIEYRIHSHYSVSKNYLSLLGESFEASIIDEENKPMILCSDVTDLSFDGYCLNVFVDDEFYEKYDDLAINHSSIKIDDTVYKMYPLARDSKNGKYIEYIEADGTKQPLMQFAIAYASEPLKGDVTVTLIEQKKVNK